MRMTSTMNFTYCTHFRLTFLDCLFDTMCVCCTEAIEHIDIVEEKKKKKRKGSKTIILRNTPFIFPFFLSSTKHINILYKMPITRHKYMLN